MAPKHTPMTSATGNTHNADHPATNPSKVATSKMAAALIKLLVPAHIASPITTSSMPSGVTNIASQVPCTVIRV